MTDEEENRSRKGTETSSFGVSKRESHDSSRFYESNLYASFPKPKEVDYVDHSHQIPEDSLDGVLLGDSRTMDSIPDDSIHLMVTSIT